MTAPAGAAAAVGTQPLVSTDGTPLPAWAVAVLETTVVDTHVHLPDVVTLRFRDADRDIFKRLQLKLGTRLAVATSPAGPEPAQQLVVAEITAFEHEHGPRGSIAVVHGYDLSHRLARGRHTRSWHDVTDSSVAKQIASAAGLEIGTVEATTLVHPHVSQMAQSDWDFLRARAQETGHEVAVVLGKFVWRKPTRSSNAPGPGDLATDGNRLQLVVGKDLLRFRPRLTASAQVAEVEVRGWDPKAKKELVARRHTGSNGARSELSSVEVAKVFGSSRPFVHSDLALHTQGEVEAAAKALAETLGSSAVEAEGEARGDPRLIAGAAVSISLAGWPYDGTYVLTTARHIYDRDGYRTLFSVTGRSERSLLGLMSMGATKGASRASGAPVPGVAVGVVDDLKDPEGLGRARVRFPWLSGDYVSHWARVTQFGAGKDRGSTFLPEVGDEVLVGFDRGDTRTPYVLGSLYNGSDKPHKNAGVDSSGQVARREIRSRQGHALVFDEKAGVYLHNRGRAAVLALEGGKVTISASGDITVTSKGKVAVSADGDLSVSSKGNLELAADGNVSVSARGNVELAATGNATLKATGQTAVSGALVKIN